MNRRASLISVTLVISREDHLNCRIPKYVCKRTREALGFVPVLHKAASARTHYSSRKCRRELYYEPFWIFLWINCVITRSALLKLKWMEGPQYIYGYGGSEWRRARAFAITPSPAPALPFTVLMATMTGKVIYPIIKVNTHRRNLKQFHLLIINVISEIL